MVKARVGVRLKEAVVGTTQSKNRSADLSQLTEKYNDFCKKLRGLITSLKGHYASMHQLQKTRLEVNSLVEIFVTCFSVQDPVGQTFRLLNYFRFLDKLCLYSLHRRCLLLLRPTMFAFAITHAPNALELLFHLRNL
jgi:hypothetical protein